MLMPAFCPNDNNGPVSQEEALKLVELMRSKFSETISKTQIVPNREEPWAQRERECSFNHACGAEQALNWCYDLITRLTIEPEKSQNSLLRAAEYLEDTARDLRRRAKPALEG